jgi:hypothetical protein
MIYFHTCDVHIPNNILPRMCNFFRLTWLNCATDLHIHYPFLRLFQVVLKIAPQMCTFLIHFAPIFNKSESMVPQMCTFLIHFNDYFRLLCRSLPQMGAFLSHFRTYLRLAWLFCPTDAHIGNSNPFPCLFKIGLTVLCHICPYTCSISAPTSDWADSIMPLTCDVHILYT